MRQVDALVIHCADTPNGKPFTARHIDRWHAARVDKRELAERAEADLRYNPSFPYIAYHDIICVDGAVQPGRGENEVSSANAPLNQTSISVCLIGMDKFTRAQWEALKIYVEDAERRYGALQVLGHRDISRTLKTCPSFDVAAWRLAGMQPVVTALLVDQ